MRVNHPLVIFDIFCHLKNKYLGFFFWLFQYKSGLKKNILTSTVISITHCGTVSFRSIDSVSPPESLHSNLEWNSQENYESHFFFFFTSVYSETVFGIESVSIFSRLYYKDYFTVYSYRKLFRFSATLPKKGPASCLSKNDRCVGRHLEISVSFLNPALLLSVYCGQNNK